MDIHRIAEKDGVMVKGLWLTKSELEKMLTSLPAAYAKEDKFLASSLWTQSEWTDKYLRQNDPFHDLIMEELEDLVAKEGINGLLKLYSSREKSNAASIIVSEDVVDDLGSRLLASNQLEAAIEVFRFNAQRHTNSARANEQLADAYLHAADKEAAIRYYRTAARLNPKSEQLRDTLAKLERGSR